MASEDGNESNDLSWTWALAGTALFGTALAAPMFILNLSQSLRDAPQTAQPAKVEVADSSERDDGDATKVEQVLQTSLVPATIVPGVGMGEISLGQRVETVLGDLGERFQPHFSSDPDGAIQHHSIALRDVDLRLDSRPQDGRIQSIRLSASTCADLEQKQPRQEGVPKTEDGLTVGSHQSRVIRMFGVPVKGKPIAPIPGPMRQPAKQVFDGITFEYCQDTMLVRAVEINRSDSPHHNFDLLAGTLPFAIAAEPTQPMAMIDPARMTRGAVAAFVDQPNTQAPKRIDLPGLDTAAAKITRPDHPAKVSEPGDLAPQFAGLDAVGVMALAPVMDTHVRPETQQVLTAASADSVNTSPVRSVSTQSLPAPEAMDQIAVLALPPESQANYTSDASSLALLPTYSGTVDRGLLALSAETSPPLIVQAPDRPSGQTVPGKPNGQPSDLASADQNDDQIGPLAEVKPGASLPVLRAQPNASLPRMAARDASRPSYQSLDEVPLPVAMFDRLVDSGVGPTAVDLPPGPPAMDAELAEASLGLNRATRRKLQRRLSLIGYDPAGIDGIFGPKTRIAIAALQADSDLEPTGFIDAQVKELIEARSQKSYAKWRKVQLKRKATPKRISPTRVAPINVARVPRAKRVPKCQRGEDGLIASNQSFSCDVDLLQESLQTLFNFRS